MCCHCWWSNGGEWWWTLHAGEIQHLNTLSCSGREKTKQKHNKRIHCPQRLWWTCMQCETQGRRLKGVKVHAQEGGWGGGGQKKETIFHPATLKKREWSISLVMVLLIESGLAEEPRAALGCAGGKGHGLQHCIENDRDNSQDDMTATIHEQISTGFSTVSMKQVPPLLYLDALVCTKNVLQNKKPLMLCLRFFFMFILKLVLKTLK